jgi:hypothetical protein
MLAKHGAHASWVALFVVLVFMGGIVTLVETGTTSASSSAQQYPINTPTTGPYPLPTQTINPYPVTATPAPPTPTAQSSPEPLRPIERRAFVTVSTRVQPSGTVAIGSLVSYRVEVSNNGDASASSARVNFDYSGDLIELIDVSFSGEGFVTERGSSSISFKTGKLLRDGGSVTAVIRARVRSTAQVNAVIRSSTDYSYSDNTGGGGGNGNSTSVTVSATTSTGPEQLVVAPNPPRPRQGEPVSFDSGEDEGFAPREELAVWYNAPDGSVVAVGRIRADQHGRARFQFDTTGLVPGDYSMVIYGLWTDLTGVGPFTIEGGR